ncbi:hypothetical protein [Streptomyces ziwulingensis]|uniref:Membrane protein n=1 Tax=Streptomyces ziwulingensis TaxID=1045501 RepID=A0ABP9CIA8_9ACTN
MGIESDQVVYEYLSRVGDVAHQRQLPSGDRMRLVAQLRNEIDRRRSKTVVDSPAAVRRILDRIGSPDEVVGAVGGTPAPAPWEAAATVPVRPDSTAPGKGRDKGRDEERDNGRDTERRKGLRRVVPRPRPAGPPPAAPEAAPPAPPTGPHLAPAHEQGTGAAGPRPDWWQADTGPFGGGDSVPGFVGGVEIPELLKPPPRPGTEQAPEQAPEKEPAPAAAEQPAEPPVRAGLLATLRKAGRTGKADAPARPAAAAAEPVVAVRRLPRLWPEGGRPNPLLLLAALLLVAGAVLGNLLPLALGWLLAFLSRRLTPAQAKWAVLGLPGTAVAAGLVWLWGRTEGRWGDPIAEGHMNDALAQTWPWVLRGAAVASALYLLWRARRLSG